MVGQGLHRVDERHSVGSIVSRPPSTATSRRSWILRSSTARSARAASGDGTRPWHRRVLLLALLVQRPSSAEPPHRRNARPRRARLSFLRRLGKRILDAPLDGRRGGSPPQTDLLRAGRSRPCAMACPDLL